MSMHVLAEYCVKMFASIILISLCFGAIHAKTDVDITWMNATLQSHFSKTRHHAVKPAYKEAAKKFILNEFKSYGLETHTHTFDTNVDKVKGKNIIGVVKGKYFNQPQDRVVGVAAHYDSLRVTPGVADNGAGVVVLMQAAKLLAKASRNFTVIFVAFDYKETESGVPNIACGGQIHPCGSANFISTWIPSFWKRRPNIAGFIVLDVIMNFIQENGTQIVPPGFDLLFPDVVARVASRGNQGDFLAAIGRPLDSVILSAFVSAYSALGQPEFQIEKMNITFLTSNITDEEHRNLYHLMRSDHYNFWINGFPAIFLTDTSDFRGYMQRCYHKSCDDMSQVTDKMIQFAGKTAQALIDTVNKLAPPSIDETSGAEISANGFQLGVLVLSFLCYSVIY